MAGSILRTPEPTASPAVSWSSAGRLVAAGTLVLGAAFELAANSIGTQELGSTTLDEVRWASENPGASNLILVFALLAVPFLAGSALVYTLLSKHRSPRLAYAGGALLGFGLVSLGAVEGYQTLAVALATDGRIDPAILAEVVEETSSLSIAVMFLMFIPFAFVGLLTSAAALWRSRAVARGAVLLIPAFIVVDFFLNEGFGIAPDFAGPAISFVAALWIASAILLAPRQVSTHHPPEM